MRRRKVSEEERSGTILVSAAKLFRDKGIGSVSIDEIVQAAGIAKGTFYLYFRTKDDLLQSLAEAVVDRMGVAVEAAADRPGNALDRFAGAVGAMKLVDGDEQYLTDALNRPENSALHERVNMALVRRLGPLLAKVIEDGREEKTFEVEDPLATIQFLLAGQAALLGGGRFAWTEAEYAARLRATLIILERALGVTPGALAPRLVEALAGATQPTSP
ncbi:TetR/AcrR family transcriptional regulator [Devosia sp.]|uniref:TetR/AcrR family transcriptional regulator n=1 Tax=Devosia sp. TaxID=1871048 RepID=UPI001AC4E3D5|nr:TetR/AcrR family transcriptional regulator [Devosia sp.]MBN9333237.1 TetR/AcrR family transcriptional regulator [Devosia sp.]